MKNLYKLCCSLLIIFFIVLPIPGSFLIGIYIACKYHRYTPIWIKNIILRLIAWLPLKKIIWLEENKEALEASNSYIQKHGLPIKTKMFENK